MDSNQNYGQEDSALVDTNSILYGSPFQEKLPTIFVIGNSESNVNPGTGFRERNTLNKEWNDLKVIAFGVDSRPWRRMLSSSFDTYALFSSRNRKKSKATPVGYVNMKFSVDGREWLSVTHYLLSMLYAPTPEYASLFSYEQRENQEGFWGTTKKALEEHQRNMNFKQYPFDPTFDANLAKHFFVATYAKITQNPILKNILLATEDAYLAERYGEITVGSPILMYIRKLVKENPNLVYLGVDTQPIVLTPDTFDKISNPHTFNYGYDKSKPLAGSVSREDLFPSMDPEKYMKTLGKGVVNREPVSEGSWIYMFVRPIDIDPDETMKVFNTNMSMVKRTVYGIERHYDSLKDLLLIGVETSSSSQTRLYRRYQLSNGISFYFEPMENGIYTVFATSENFDTAIVQYMTKLEPDEQDPTGLQEEPYILPILKNPVSVAGQRLESTRKLVQDPLTYEQVVFQFEKIQNFLSSPKVMSFNTVTKTKLLTVLRDELVLRSLTNGERLLTSPGSRFVSEFSMEFGLVEKWVSTFFEISEYPQKPVNKIDLPSFLKEPPNKGLTKKGWLLWNSLVIDTSKYYRLPKDWVKSMSEDREFDDEVFSPYSVKGGNSFRGFSWIDSFPENVDSNRGVRWLCEVPSQKQVEVLFLERLNQRLQDAISRNVPLEVVIVSRTQGPLYDWLINANQIVFRRNIEIGSMQENPFTGQVSSSTKPKILAIARSSENFQGVDLAKIAGIVE